MEHGFWGHNSTFSDPQTRTPLVLWMPGLGPGVHDKLTSHLDIPATLMPLLGVTNPVGDYALGHNLLSDAQREYVLLSDWSHLGYRSNLIKVSMPVKAQGGIGRKITGPQDQILTNDQIKDYFRREQGQLARALADIGRFIKKD